MVGTKRGIADGATRPSKRSFISADLGISPLTVQNIVEEEEREKEDDKEEKGDGEMEEGGRRKRMERRRGKS